MKIIKWSMSALLAAALFFVGGTPAFANTLVASYLFPGEHFNIGADRYYVAGEPIRLEYLTSSDSNHSLYLQVKWRKSNGDWGYVYKDLVAKPGEYKTFVFNAPYAATYWLESRCGASGYYMEDCTTSAFMDDVND